MVSHTNGCEEGSTNPGGLQMKIIVRILLCSICMYAVIFCPEITNAGTNDIEILNIKKIDNSIKTQLTIDISTRNFEKEKLDSILAGILAEYKLSDGYIYRKHPSSIYIYAYESRDEYKRDTSLFVKMLSWREGDSSPNISDGIFKLFDQKGSELGDTSPHRYSLKNSSVWYAKLLRSTFKDNILIHGIELSTDEVFCLPYDITKFDVDYRHSNTNFGRAFEVYGFLNIGEIIKPFKVINGQQGKKYMLRLQAYIIDPTGNVVWEQAGYPQEDLWVKSSGGKYNFRLVNRCSFAIANHKLMLIAVGDPIFVDNESPWVILGAKTFFLQEKSTR